MSPSASASAGTESRISHRGRRRFGYAAAGLIGLFFVVLGIFVLAPNKNAPPDVLGALPADVRRLR